MEFNPMRSLVLCLFLASLAHAQQWVKTEYRDDLHNETGLKFSLDAKEKGGTIQVVCSKGKLKAAWLFTDRVADVQVKENLIGDLSSEVDVEYRRDDEQKPHHLSLPVSKNLHGILLERSHGFADVADKGTFTGLENLLYGPAGLGGGEWRKNKKVNNWAKRLIVGVSAFGESDAVYTFEVPDPSEIRQECDIK
jgi:hypothetical protein